MNRAFHIIFLLCIFFFFLESCTKKDDKPYDSRDNFIGKYQVTLTVNCYGPCGTCSSVRDTVIVVQYGLTDSTIDVLGRDVFLDPEGYYGAYHYMLRMWNDSIYSNFMNGGLGCGAYESYEGYRISDDPS